MTNIHNKYSLNQIQYKTQIQYSIKYKYSLNKSLLLFCLQIKHPMSDVSRSVFARLESGAQPYDAKVFHHMLASWLNRL